MAKDLKKFSELEDEPISCIQASRFVGKVYNRKISRVTMWKWMLDGRSGEKLETVDDPNRPDVTCTTRRKLRKFMDKFYQKQASKEEVLSNSRQILEFCMERPKDQSPSMTLEKFNLAVKVMDTMAKTIPGFIQTGGITINSQTNIVLTETERMEAARIAGMRVGEILANPDLLNVEAREALPEPDEPQDTGESNEDD